MNELRDILDAREKRVKLQDELRREYKLPILVIRANMPGINKDNEISINIVEAINEVILEILSSKIEETIFINNGEGPIFIHLVNLDAIELKGVAILTEETHQLGRCVDIDVYTVEGGGLSRTDLGYSGRKCFLCDEEAHICVRSRAHELEDLMKFIKDRYNDYCNYRS